MYAGGMSFPRARCAAWANVTSAIAVSIATACVNAYSRPFI
jgi:hypothetical protein